MRTSINMSKALTPAVSPREREKLESPAVDSYEEGVG
jgi:hypothetical protein